VGEIDADKTVIIPTQPRAALSVEICGQAEVNSFELPALFLQFRALLHDIESIVFQVFSTR
jgi:hypothetical protein